MQEKVRRRSRPTPFQMKMQLFKTSFYFLICLKSLSQASWVLLGLVAQWAFSLPCKGCVKSFLFQGKHYILGWNAQRDRNHQNLIPNTSWPGACNISDQLTGKAAFYFIIVTFLYGYNEIFRITEIEYNSTFTQAVLKYKFEVLLWALYFHFYTPLHFGS